MRRWGAGVFGRVLCSLSLAGTLAVAGAAPAQGPPAQNTGQDTGQGEGRRGGQFAGMARVAGEVTAVSGPTVTVKSEDGSTVQVFTTDNTRVMKERGPVKVSDLHPGDGLMAVGNLDPATGTLHAAMVMAEDAAQVKAMRENLGKTYITGRVTAVNLDDAKMTVERPDHVAQTIGFDESTSFKRAVRKERPGGGAADGTPGENGGGGGRSPGGGAAMAAAANGGAGLDRAFAGGESITLADIKVGDNVVGTGALKAGVFVPARLLDSPRGQRRGNNGGAQGTAVPAPANPGPGSL